MSTTTARRTARKAGAWAILALLVVVAVVLGGRLTGAGGPAAAAQLPDPQDMALQATGRGTPTEIAEFWADAARKDPTNSTLVRLLGEAQSALARSSGDLRLYAAAEETLREAVRLAPDDNAARLAFAWVLSAQHRFVEAELVVSAVLAEDPQSVAALLYVGDLRIELGELDAAENAIGSAARQLGGDPPALLSRWAKLAAARGDTPAALRLAEAALLGAGDLDVTLAEGAFYWSQLAHYSFRVGDIDGAEAAARSALVVDPGNLGARELLANVLATRGDEEGREEAMSMYESLLADGPAADLHGRLALLLGLEGRGAEAQWHVDAGLALARDPHLQTAAERRHLISFLSEHDPQLALELARADLAERRDVEAHAWVAWALHRTGDTDSAVEALAPVLAARTDDPWLLYQAGMILADVGDREEAEVLLRRALDINPRFDVRHADLAAERLLAL